MFVASAQLERRELLKQVKNRTQRHMSIEERVNLSEQFLPKLQRTGTTGIKVWVLCLTFNRNLHPPLLRIQLDPTARIRALHQAVENCKVVAHDQWSVLIQEPQYF